MALSKLPEAASAVRGRVRCSRSRGVGIHRSLRRCRVLGAGLPAAVGYGAGFVWPEARSAVVAELPQYGDYDFEAAAAGPDSDGAWSGAVQVDIAAPDGSPAAIPAADLFAGDWQAATYGPAAVEIAGRLRLWTRLADGAGPQTGWPAQAVLVAGFGAKRSS